MSVEVKTPTKSNFEIQSFSSPEGFRRSKDDGFLKNESKFSQPWGRKRRFSQSYRKEEGAMRRKRLKSSPAGPLPNRFLNGGSIDDPLNLNGLDTSELGRQLNSVTPKSSPLPPATRRESVEVRIPINVTDPLNLNDSSEETDLEKLFKKKKQRNRHKKKDEPQIFSPPKHVSKDKSLLEALKIDVEPEPSTSDSLKQQKEVQKPRQVSNKIVSPVIPQISPKSKKRRRTNSGSKPEPSQSVTRSLHSFPSGKNDKKTSPKKFKQPRPPGKKSDAGNKKHQGPKFIYGNYNRYYGYRNPSLEDDARLKCFRKEWFESKSVLDIGCNVGHMTLSMACLFQPAKIVGIDIDPKLIMNARKNIRYYMSSDLKDSSKFPISNMLSYGPIVAPPISQEAIKQPAFPQNVLFKQGNYVLECDQLLDLQKEEYDCILALSVSKWIHFNWGDDGLKRFFKRVYKQLRPGGRFILEPQPWSSYKKKKKLTDEIHENFRSIRLRPDQFTDYLLSREIGFNTCNTLDVPYNASKGFRRAVLMFTKSDTIQNSPRSEISVSTPRPCPSATSMTPAYSEDSLSTLQPSASATSMTPAYSEDSSSSSSCSSESEWSASSETSRDTATHRNRKTNSAMATGHTPVGTPDRERRASDKLADKLRSIASCESIEMSPPGSVDASGAKSHTTDSASSFECTEVPTFSLGTVELVSSSQRENMAVGDDVESTVLQTQSSGRHIEITSCSAKNVDGVNLASTLDKQGESVTSTDSATSGREVDTKAFEKIETDLHSDKAASNRNSETIDDTSSKGTSDEKNNETSEDAGFRRCKVLDGNLDHSRNSSDDEGSQPFDVTNLQSGDEDCVAAAGKTLEDADDSVNTPMVEADTMDTLETHVEDWKDNAVEAESVDEKGDTRKVGKESSDNVTEI